MRITRWIKQVIYLCLLLVTVLTSTPLHAEDINVTVGVGDNILVVQGQTSPTAFVTISRDGSVIGTTTAGSDGLFSQTFPAQTPGLHEIKAVAQTTTNNTTDPVVVTINVIEHATTTVDLFLPPTMVIANTNLAYGEPLQATGETCPSCTLTFYMDNSNYATTTANSLGQWSISIGTTDLSSGQHSVFARATNSSGGQSYPTSLRNFTAAASPIPPPGQGGEEEPTPISPPALPPTGNQKPGVPTITFPPPGSVWTSPTITLRGNAEPGTQVEIFDGNKSLGSTWADSNGQWSLTIGLESRNYSLRARACRNDVCSDLSGPIGFTAQPPSIGLIIDLEKTLFSTLANQPISLQGVIKGGQSPYAITINWGENQAVDHTSQNQTSIKITHTYAKPGRYTGWLEAQDTDKRAARVYFTVNVTARTDFIPWFTLLIIIILPLILIYIIWRLLRHRKKSQEQPPAST